MMEATKWIKLWIITWATEDMKGWIGKEINWVWYYTFDQAIETAKQQWLTIPTIQDFTDSWFTYNRSEENKELADKLGLTLDSYCGSDGELNDEGIGGCRWSASSKDESGAQYFKFGKDEGTLGRGNRGLALPVRPVLKTPVSDISSIWQFSTQELWDELGKRILSIND